MGQKNHHVMVSERHSAELLTKSYVPYRGLWGRVGWRLLWALLPALSWSASHWPRDTGMGSRPVQLETHKAQGGGRVHLARVCGLEQSCKVTSSVKSTQKVKYQAWQHFFRQRLGAFSWLVFMLKDRGILLPKAITCCSQRGHSHRGFVEHALCQVPGSVPLILFIRAPHPLHTQGSACSSRRAQVSPGPLCCLNHSSNLSFYPSVPSSDSSLVLALCVPICAVGGDGQT